MSEPTILLYIARHGQTTLNAANKFRGNADPSLDDKGFRDANQLAKFFEEQPLSFVVSSDKLRARQTAKTIAGNKHKKVYDTDTLRALNVGDFSGKERNEENVAALQCYLECPDKKIPGGESLNTFKSRIRPAILEAIDMSNEAGEPGLLVAHSSVVHEASDMVKGSHTACLVEPGGVVAIYVKNGKLGMEALFKPFVPPPTQKADTVS